MRIITLAAFIIFAAFCIIVAVANRVDVTFSLAPLPISWNLPLYILLFAGIFIGLGAGSLVVVAKSVRHARHNRKQTKIIRELEKQIKDQIKNMSPTESAGEIPQDQKQIS
ncbi:hypothetical protein MNBD_ALPHA03-1328 [hydrothermal vent metagenome]|uniref:Lipopolysaccharide assembly protein A domain-containing protein n=1 Tax=hydrothermal vent metagenome TaxID=652676 RepID=A0A3B1ATY8_9ZZZZ